MATGTCSDVRGGGGMVATGMHVERAPQPSVASVRTKHQERQSKHPEQQQEAERRDQFLVNHRITV
jgi:hypothetical protein